MAPCCAMRCTEKLPHPRATAPTVPFFSILYSYHPPSPPQPPPQARAAAKDRWVRRQPRQPDGSIRIDDLVQLGEWGGRRGHARYSSDGTAGLTRHTESSRRAWVRQQRRASVDGQPGAGGLRRVTSAARGRRRSVASVSSAGTRHTGTAHPRSASMPRTPTNRHTGTGRGTHVSSGGSGSDSRNATGERRRRRMNRGRSGSVDNGGVTSDGSVASGLRIRVPSPAPSGDPTTRHTSAGTMVASPLRRRQHPQQQQPKYHVARSRGSASSSPSAGALAGTPPNGDQAQSDRNGDHLALTRHTSRPRLGRRASASTAITNELLRPSVAFGRCSAR